MEKTGEAPVLLNSTSHSQQVCSGKVTPFPRRCAGSVTPLPPPGSPRPTATHPQETRGCQEFSSNLGWEADFTWTQQCSSGTGWELFRHVECTAKLSFPHRSGSKAKLDMN